MNLIIAANKINLNGFKIGEKIRVEIDKLESSGNNMIVDLLFFNENGVSGNFSTMNFLEIPRRMVFQSENNHYKTYAAKLIKQQLIDNPNLDIVDADVQILAELDWKEESRPIRVTIPKDIILDDPNYTELISYVKSMGIPHHSINGCMIVYLEEIYNTPEAPHRALFESTPSVIIEE